MPAKKNYWSPAEGYDFKLMIDDLDYSADLVKVKILTSITAPYQTVILNLHLDPNDIILKRVYGQSVLKLTLMLKDQEQQQFDLMYISSEFQIPIRSIVTQNIQKDRSLITIVTILQKSFKFMTSIVNEVYYAKTVRKIIENLIEDNTDAKLEYGSIGENKNILDQVIIPPVTLYKSIKYLDKNFGLYNGPSVIFCLNNGTIYIKNLKQKMNMNQIFTIYQLSSGDKDFSKVVGKCIDGKHFYTTNEISTSYSGNTIFSALAPTLKYITKPRNTLYHIITKDLSSFCTEYGLISNNETDIYYNTTGISKDKRISYYSESGNDTDETFINANLSRSISSLVTLSMDIERDVMIMNLMNVGESVLFNSKTLEMNQFSGKYILKSSEINFDRTRIWQGTARIHLIRTNRSSN